MGKFTIAHMYPELMNLYGDRGNLICLQKRLEWYGFDCRISNLHLGDDLDLTAVDMLFMGGGSDRGQGLVYHDLFPKKGQLEEQIQAGLPVLCIGGAYQLLGEYYKTPAGQITAGLGLFPYHTVGLPSRLIGDIIIESEINGQIRTVVGFENHCGRTHFQDKILPAFGKVIKGYGSNAQDQTEGIRFQNLIGTYLHGPLLPKNPPVADFFIQAMTHRRGITLEGRLDDSIENFAHEQARKKIMAT